MKKTLFLITVTVLTVSALAGRKSASLLSEIWQAVDDGIHGLKVTLVDPNQSVLLWPSSPAITPLEVLGAPGQVAAVLSVAQGQGGVSDILQLRGEDGAYVMEVFARGGTYLASQDSSGNAVLFVDGGLLEGPANLIEGWDRNYNLAFTVDSEDGSVSGWQLWG